MFDCGTDQTLAVHTHRGPRAPTSKAIVGRSKPSTAIVRESNHQWGQTARGASKGGVDVGPRARVAAAACVVASGLLVGGLSTATAFAESGHADTRGTTKSGTDQTSPPSRENDTAPTDVVRDLKKGDEPDAEGRADEKLDGLDDGKGDDEKGDDENGDDENGDDGRADVDRDDRDPAPVRGNDKEDNRPPVVEPNAGDAKDPPQNLPEDPPKGVPPVPSEGGVEVPGREDDGGVTEPVPPRPPCCEKGEGCAPWWPWPWPQPDPEDEPGSSGGGGDFGGGAGGLPVGLPFPFPDAQRPELFPPTGELLSPDVLDTVPGVGTALGDLPAAAPVSVPVLVAVPTGTGPAAAAGTGPGVPAAPRLGTAEPPPARQPMPASVGSNVAMPASSYRVGYGEYLRSAGLSQIAALAVSGVAGILLLTGAGGFVGYRQAKSGRALRTTGPARFIN